MMCTCIYIIGKCLTASVWEKVHDLQMARKKNFNLYSHSIVLHMCFGSKQTIIPLSLRGVWNQYLDYDISLHQQFHLSYMKII